MAKAKLQDDLFAPAPDWPEGFRYAGDMITLEEEAALVAAMGPLGFRPFQFQGYLGHREVVSFGWRYDYADRLLKPAGAMPDWLLPLKTRAEAFAGLPDGALVQALLTRYAPGTTIGWHRDRPDFQVVVGFSLLSPAVLRFRRAAPGGGWERKLLTVEPRSAYVLDGPARSQWEHSLRPVEALRYSITFRSLRTARASAA
jgi:alkylated DNA repair dioxygenase AlkB